MNRKLSATAISVYVTIHRDSRLGFYDDFPSPSIVRAKWITNYGIISSLYSNELLDDYEHRLLCKYNDIYYCKRW